VGYWVQRDPALVVGCAITQSHRRPGVGELVKGNGNDQDEDGDQEIYRI
jgi:hypothetical protein